MIVPSGRTSTDPASKHDIALLKIEPDDFTRSHGQPILIGWDSLRTDQPLNVTAAGFPRLRRNPKDKSHDSEQIFGKVYLLSAVKGQSFEIKDVEHHKIDGDWRGFSGAALFAGDQLIGVVSTRVAEAQGIDFRAMRIDSPSANGEFCALVRLLMPRVVNANLGIAWAFQGKTKRFREQYLVSETGPVPFGGRDEELQRLDKWLQDNSASPRMLVTAPAGRGKSALLVHWVNSLQEREVADGGWQVTFMPISILSETNRPSVFYGGLAQRLAEITGMGSGSQATFTPPSPSFYRGWSEW
jgi:hypothetical protein